MNNRNACALGWIGIGKMSEKKKKEESTEGWIYVGADCEKLNWCKVGKTDGNLKTRHRSAQNPNFFIYGAFLIKGNSIYKYNKEILGIIETLIHKQLTHKGGHALTPLKHFSTGTDSECYCTNPETMMGYVEHILVTQAPYFVCVKMNNQIYDAYRFPQNQWWKNGDLYDSRWNPPANLKQEPTRTVPNECRQGIVTNSQRYFTVPVSPDVYLGGSIFVDVETGEQYDADELESEDYDDDPFSWQ
ncbi:hypothetical protein [Photobacterium damselae]|uniref:hypothetical protein n=1 Tax=Photobacterium damselae TaxID=38293 RepID=UPI001F166622|nr:hypothetical protein [Photobacterium damselae]UKA04796.1 hypothetical protein IHC89_21375 [Photobacterium damselae subsp. damselae]